MSLETEKDRLEMLKSLGSMFTANNQSLFGVFDKPFTGLELNDVVESSTPMLLVRSSDAKALSRGTVVQHNGQYYRVESKEDDGEGMTNVKLSES